MDKTILNLEFLENKYLMDGDCNCSCNCVPIDQIQTQYQSSIIAQDQQGQDFTINYSINYNNGIWNYQYQTDKNFDNLFLQTPNGLLQFTGNTLEFQSNFSPIDVNFFGNYTEDIIGEQFIASFLEVSPGRNVSYALFGNNSTTTAGVFKWKNADGEIFTAFCAELQQYTGNNINFTYENANDSIKELFGRFYSTIDTPDESAAFQSAIWEILNDPNNFDLSNGNFKLLTNNAIKNLAESYVSALDGDSSYFQNNVFKITNPNNQDQIVVKDLNEFVAHGIILGPGYQTVCQNTCEPVIPVCYPKTNFITVNQLFNVSYISYLQQPIIFTGGYNGLGPNLPPMAKYNKIPIPFDEELDTPQEEVSIQKVMIEKEPLRKEQIVIPEECKKETVECAPKPCEIQQEPTRLEWLRNLLRLRRNR